MSALQSATLRPLQRRLEQFYALERTPDVVDFVRVGKAESREVLLLRETGGELEMALCLPFEEATPVAAEAAPSAANANDVWLQLVEGVSHFVYIAERARTGLPTTQLELELQAEVDKFVLSGLGDEPLGQGDARALHGLLYEQVRFLHPANTEAGARYRLANDLAARFVARFMQGTDVSRIRGLLRRFYRSGQTEKIRLASVA